jgi:signal transduction histidine kinase
LNLTGRQKYFLPAAAVPVLITLFFIVSAFVLGNPGFKVDKTQHGLKVSQTLENLNPVQPGDIIIAVNGLPCYQVFGYLLTLPEQPEHQTFTLVHDGQIKNVLLRTEPYSPGSLLAAIWPHLLLIALFLLLGMTAILRAAPDKTTFLFFLMLCGFASSIASTLASHLGLISPPIMSASFIGIAIFNWFSFGAWAHFTCSFPAERDITLNRPWLPALFYLFPPVLTIVLSFALGGIHPEFWGWIQRLRNMFLPAIICGTFIKHLVDFLKLAPSNPVRNQIKLSLAAFWLSFGPYLFLYLLPNLIVDHPLIYFRTIVLTFLILPLAYLIALLRYRLFEVDKMISKIMAYIVLIISFTLVYSLLLVVMKRWLWGKGILSEELFLVFLVMVIVIFNPAVNWVQKKINRYIFGNIPLTTPILHTLSRRINAALQIPDLVRVVTHDLPEKFGLNRVALAVKDNKQLRFYPEQSTRELRLQLERQTFPEQDEYCLCRQIQNNDGRKDDGEQPGIHDWTIIFRLQGSSGPTGFLFIGEKNNNRLLTDDDIHFLATLSNHIGVALENGLRYERLARSKDQQEEIFKKLMQNEKMAAIGEMTTTLAHELKNPLATIRSSAQYVAQKPRSQEVSQEILGYIIEEVDALNLTISSLLGLARHREPIFKPIDLYTVIPAIINRWQHSDDHIPSIALSCDISEEMPKLHCDINQLSQIILNLVRNAEEAIEQQGEICIQIRMLGDHALITIFDNGPGITRERLQHIFHNFYTTKENGLGLGLPTCRQLVHAHHGSINIKNRKNSGTKAMILLPFNQNEGFSEA